MEYAQNMGRWESIEIGHEWENRNVSLADISKDPRVWIHEQEVWNRVETTNSGQCQKLLRPLHDHHLAIADVDTTDEDIETISNKGGVKFGERCHCHEVFQGR
jgi:hypothetical protein